MLTGVAALVAGAFSMGTGEYISVTNQNELVHAEVALEQKMHALFPVAEQEELAGYFREYGADPETADRMAAAVSKDPGTALRVHAREELGVDPADLPSPLLAGFASLCAFSLGALVPLLPYLVGLPRPGRHPGHHGRGAAGPAEWSWAGSPGGRCCARASASSCWAEWPSR